MSYVDDQLNYIESLAQELEAAKERHKLELQAIKARLEDAAIKALEYAPNGDQALEIASTVYWKQEAIPTRVIYDFYGIAPQAVAERLYRETYAVPCHDCKQVFDEVLTSRSHYQNIRRSQLAVCPECEAKRKQRWAEYDLEEQAKTAEIQRLKTIPYKEYLQSEHWKETRRQALKRAGFKCQLCNQGGMLDVHHRTYERRGEEKNSDLIVLCRPCHAKFHDKDV